MFRSTLARNARLFSTNARLQKSAIDTAKDGLKSIDRTVSDTLIKGIDSSGMFLDRSITSSQDTSSTDYVYALAPHISCPPLFSPADLH